MGYAKLKQARKETEHTNNVSPSAKRTLVLVCVGLISAIVVCLLSCLLFKIAVTDVDVSDIEEVDANGNSSLAVKPAEEHQERTRRLNVDKVATPSMDEVAPVITRKVIDDVTPIDLPILDMLKWYDIDYNRKTTRVQKERLFRELVEESVPARNLTSMIAGLEDYTATENTSFFWVPFPDGISYVVTEVQEFTDSLDVRLKLKDQYEKDRVKDVYTVPARTKYAGQWLIEGKLAKFKKDYFSLCLFRSNPQYAAMSNLNIGDVVISRDWGNLFVITEVNNGANGFIMDQKSFSCDMRPAILQAVKAISIQRARGAR